MRPFLLCVLSLPLLACAQPVAVAVSPKAERAGATTVRGATSAALPLRARLTEDVIKEAVRGTLAENPVKREASPGGQVLGGEKYQAFSRNFKESKKPSCMGADATKFQPASSSTKDWAFSANGLFVLPFWASAIVKGKCN